MFTLKFVLVQTVRTVSKSEPIVSAFKVTAAVAAYLYQTLLEMVPTQPVGSPLSRVSALVTAVCVDRY